MTKYFAWSIVFPINIVLFLINWSIQTIANALQILTLPMDTMDVIEQSIDELKRENQ